MHPGVLGPGTLLFLFLWVSALGWAQSQESAFRDSFEKLTLGAQTADDQGKTVIADQLVSLGRAQASLGNEKNAYDAFRLAVQVAPTHPIATQEYLKLRTKGDPRLLVNAPVSPGVASPAAAPDLPRPSVPAVDLTRVQAQLQAIRAQLRTLTDEVRLRGDQPGVEKSLALMAEAMTLQAQVAPTIVVPPAPQLETLVLQGQRMGVLVVGVAVVLVLLAALLVIVTRPRHRSSRGPSAPGDASGVGADGAGLVSATPRESLPQGDLVLWARLQGLQDHARAGTLRWNTVSENLALLNGSLKAQILDLVEGKLRSGDLASYDAVLPILFPFLNEYDEYFREKADALARAALVSQARDSESSTLGPYGVDRLHDVVDRLHATLRGADRSLMTAKVARSIAHHLGHSPRGKDQVYRGALARDAGYLVLDPDRLLRILGQPVVAADDRAFVQSHVEAGLAFFDHDPAMPGFIRDAILFHHERLDGSGYPRGLGAEEIPAIARIVAVAETFVSLVTRRERRLDVEEALAVLQEGRGIKYDEAAVDAVQAVYPHLGAL